VKCLICGLFVLLAMRDTAAQQVPVHPGLIGTTYVAFIPSLSDGHLRGCTFEFQASIEDWQARSGAPSVVFGSFGILRINSGTSGGFVKAVVHELSVSEGTTSSTAGIG